VMPCAPLSIPFSPFCLVVSHTPLPRPLPDLPPPASSPSPRYSESRPSPYLPSVLLSIPAPSPEPSPLSTLSPPLVPLRPPPWLVPLLLVHSLILKPRPHLHPPILLLSLRALCASFSVLSPVPPALRLAAVAPTPSPFPALLVPPALFPLSMLLAAFSLVLPFPSLPAPSTHPCRPLLPPPRRVQRKHAAAAMKEGQGRNKKNEE
ncbi:hypothetical protein DFH06DRAFT_1447614, partial [Mycena polygramma]